MAKIAVELEQAVAQRRRAGAPGSADSRLIASGNTWQVSDVLCTNGPCDRRFEERHLGVSIAMVLAGTFQYRASANGSQAKTEIMTPGSLLLGGAGQLFECGHDHGTGDRCIAFWYTPERFEEIASNVGVRHTKSAFPILRVPALQDVSPLIAQAALGITQPFSQMVWEEISLKIAALTVQLVHGVKTFSDSLPSDHARISRTLRRIEADLGRDWTLSEMALEASLSPHHFLRTFEAVAGITPHQFLLRTRLREAALRLTSESDKIVDIALGCGFGDISNFNRAFRREFGIAPRAFRKSSQHRDTESQR